VGKGAVHEHGSGQAYGAAPCPRVRDHESSCWNAWARAR